MKKVMVRAWQLAKMAVSKFGGKAKDYFSQALTVAWDEVKKGARKMKATVYTTKKQEVEMHYSEYKNSYSTCKTVKDSYNASAKTIKVLVETVDVKEVSIDELRELVTPLLKKDEYGYLLNLKKLEDAKFTLSKVAYQVENMIFGFDRRRKADEFIDALISN